MKFLISLVLTLAPAYILTADATKVTITGNDTMQFDLKKFEAKAGEKVELTFKNIGKIQSK